MSQDAEEEVSRTNGVAAQDNARVRQKIMSNSTRVRIPALHSLQTQLLESDVQLLDLSDIIDTLFDTFGLYTDVRSRHAVERCLLAAFSTNTEATEHLLTFLARFVTEASKQTHAPGTAFVLIRWASILLQSFPSTPSLWEQWGPKTLRSLAHLLDLFYASVPRPSTENSALRATRRGFRIFFSSEFGSTVLEHIVQDLTTKSPNPVPENGLVLGVISGVAHRLPNTCNRLQRLKPSYNAFIVRELIGSRRQLPRYITESLRDYYQDFVEITDLETDLVPPLEKALLRAPEVVLHNVMPSLIAHLPFSLDLSDILANHLTKPLLASAKSSTIPIKTSALFVFQALAARCSEEAAKEKIMTEVLTPLSQGKLNSADHRCAHALLINALSSSPRLALKIPDSMIAMALKESNETAANAEIAALFHHLHYGIEHGIAPSKQTVDAVAKGLAERKLQYRRIWTERLADTFWTLTPGFLLESHVRPFVEMVAAKLIDSWNEIQSTNLASSQQEFIATACAATATCLARLEPAQDLDCAKTIQTISMASQTLRLDPKPSFLLNHRTYSKMTDAQDLTWFLRALVSTEVHATTLAASRSVQIAWASAFIFLIVAGDVPPEVRREAKTQLIALHRSRPKEISQSIIAGLRSWCVEVESETKETSPATAARSSRGKLHTVVQCLCHAQKADVPNQSDHPNPLDEQLLDLLTLCRPQLIPRSNWLEVCLATGTDPGALVERHHDTCIERVLAPSKDPILSKIPAFLDAASSAAADLAFVAPKVMLPKVTDQIAEDLDPLSLQNIGPTEAAIYRTPLGTLFVDVLAKQTPMLAISSENTEENDTLKWEAELRAQLAAKQGNSKKLTAEEQAKVDAQATKEATIRERVVNTIFRLKRGIGLIHALVTGPPTDTEDWFGVCSQRLLDLIVADTGLVLGQEAVLAYLDLSAKTSSRLGPLRTFVGVATLRSAGDVSLPELLTKEPLGDLVTRLLYRLRFMGEQRSLDPVTLDYALPLIFLVLGKGGIGKSGDDGDEQIVLAAEFLSYHTAICADSRLPRQRLLTAIVKAMQSHSAHFRLFKDCLNDTCRNIAPNITEAEANVLVRAAIAREPSVRTAALQAISAELELPFKPFFEEIWLACHDDLDQNIELAQDIWEENALQVTPSALNNLLVYIGSNDSQLRRATARSLAEVVKRYKDSFGTLLTQLQQLYTDKAKEQPVSTDNYGMPLKVRAQDPWTTRHGIALTFKELAPHFDSRTIVAFMEFMVADGPLGDTNPTVQEAMVDAAMTLVTVSAANKVEQLMKLFEDTLSRPESASAQQDSVNEAVVVLYGALARHLERGDVQIPKVVQRLLDTLNTPSESVQHAVAQCLPPLVQASGAEAGNYLQQMMDQLKQGKNYAARRGAAYGLAGVVKGRGLLALRQFRIMSTLAEGSTNKKDPNQRQGTFLAYELLSLILGRVFEPYILQIVPHLLTGFGDTSSEVRKACLDAAKTCFASLSSFGVKQVLPVLLEGLDDDQWRSKKGACDSLGAMAYLDPRQLASSLPDIIPPLTEVLNDSHKEVRASANRSLQRFGDVISNPEIKSQVQILLKALSDPTRFTDDALDALIKVNFVHYLDAPSLALVVRILERGLGDRSATKRKSSQIIGSLAHLTDRKDLIAHLPVLVAGLRVAIVDAVPATRATASKALGSAVEKLGEDALPDLIPSLMATLKADTGAGDRLGSAQALSEVLAGLGTRRLEETLPTILQNVSSSKASVREGFMSLFIYLPVTFGNSFSNYLASIIPPILSGLADDVESIRETSLRAGRLLVKNFATRAIDLLLPELERGLADDSHRIRLSSVELVGELLFNLTGISGKSEEESEEAASKTGQSLLDILGEEKRNKVLSALYICRNDTSGLVKAAAVDVWKALVSTPRTLRELVPTLTQLLIRRLASTNMEQKVIAGNALGELIRKAGENVLATLLPTLEESLQTSTDTDARQGICIALRELMSAASAEGLEEYEKTLIAVVRTALVDSDANVREAAAEAFDSMQRVFGKKAVDQVLPHLLKLLQSSDEAENSLSALLTLLTDQTRSNIILPNLLPTLLTLPISAFNARALAALASVARTAMTRRLPNILNALLDSAISTKDEALKEELDNSFESILLSVDEFDGLNTAISVMLGLVKHDDHRKRAKSEMHLAAFFTRANVDYSRYHPDLIRVLLIAFDDGDNDVVKAAWTALTALTSRLRKEEMEGLVISTKQTLTRIGVPGHDLPGFSLPKGISAILPIFLQGLMNGTTEQRSHAALALSDIISRTSADGLKPFVTQITGPLIRVLSERSVEVKAAILFTLNNLLEKIPLLLKPFLPQLQRTFAKSLADPTSEVLRGRAAKALGTLITLTPRVDPLIAELVTGSKTSDAGVRDAMIKALFEVVSKAGSLMSDGSKDSILGLIDSDSGSDDTRMATTNARLLGALVKVLPAETSYTLIKNRVLTAQLTHASTLALNAILLDAPDSLTKPFEDALPLTISKGISLTTTGVPEASVLAAGKYLLLLLKSPLSPKQSNHLETLLARLTSTLDPRSGTRASIDVRRLVLVVLRTFFRHATSQDQHATLVEPYFSTLAPPIFACVRDPVIPIKLAAEQAFLALFSVADVDAELFDKYVTRATEAGAMDAASKRGMGDYFRRVALRLGAQARERKEAEGGAGGLGLSSDEAEDEKEVWSIGREAVTE